MKIRNPLMIRLTALGMSWVMRAWLGSLTFRACYDDPDFAPQNKRGRRGLYLFWHEMLLLPPVYARHGFCALASQHADGELIAQLVHMLGGRAVRGSTSKSGLTALREMMRAGRFRHLAITPDGPRGPRRVLKQGAVFLASKTGMPLVPVGLAPRDCWRHRSWDRMAIPKPGTIATVVVGSPIDVPADLDRDGVEHYRSLAQTALDDVQERAEATVTGRIKCGQTD
jgi:lysophospholipid acyltransferase (LPLAT)-like uncharacterized protein